MNNGFFKTFKATNEPVREYKDNSNELNCLMKQYKSYKEGFEEVPMYIGGKKIKSEEQYDIIPPHEHNLVIGKYHKGNKKHIRQAIDEALKAKKHWENMSWENRVSIFIKAANLLKYKYRDRINASTMICQSKNFYQAEIDAACELIDFLNFNVEFAQRIYSEQPLSTIEIWNRLNYRPLEGFIYAVTPFNFTSIAANLAICPAILGNVVVWKPSEKQMLSAKVTMEVLEEAGLPDGVINMLVADPKEASDEVLSHRDFAGLHFTGSTFVFQKIWNQIGNNIYKYKSYPKIVGETGGKDFIWAHSSADIQTLATSISRGSFEYQGQKCSAASRIYIPKSIYNDIKPLLIEDVESMSIGSPEDHKNFINAVIDKVSFDRLSKIIDKAKNSKEEKIICGGSYSDKEGYFIKPTLIETKNPNSSFMSDEFFGPIATIYVYEDADWENSLKILDETSNYGLTGAILSKDRTIIEKSTKLLRNSAGNLYINDKPTGAVVGNQPFGGGRLSGTNDKSGSFLNLIRWLSPQTIKENFYPPTNYRY